MREREIGMIIESRKTAVSFLLQTRIHIFLKLSTKLIR